MLTPDTKPSETPSGTGPRMPDQRSLTDQLRDLIQVANKAGMYDAADFLQDLVERKG